MNHLAHCLLARRDDEWIVGNLVADHVRGSVQELPYSNGIKTGIAQHRRIDSFTDTHALVRAASKLLHGTQRKFAPIVVDVAFDYFLARHWNLFVADISLDDFGHKVCSALVAHENILPEPLKTRLPLMVAHNFLTSYRTTDGMYRAFRNIASRSHFEHNLLNAVDDVLAQENSLEALFLDFFPELRQHIEEHTVIFD